MTVRKKAAMTKIKPFPTQDRVQKALFDLIAEKGLVKARISTLAKSFGVSTAEFYKYHPSVEAIINGFMDDIDASMIANTNVDSASNKREAYFDLMMARLDVLQENRAGVIRWLKDSAKTPNLWPSIAKRWSDSLSLMLDLAQDSPLFPVKKIGLAGVYAYTLRAWMEDETPDMAKTMAALDQALDKAEKFAETFLIRRHKS